MTLVLGILALIIGIKLIKKSLKLIGSIFLIGAIFVVLSNSGIF